MGWQCHRSYRQLVLTLLPLQGRVRLPSLVGVRLPPPPSTPLKHFEKFQKV